MNKKNFFEFRESVVKLANQRPKQWRWGQAIFNYMEQLYGDIARTAQFEYNTDCFYNDSCVDDFINVCFVLYNKDENLY